MHAAKRVRVKCLHTLLGLNLAAGPQQEHTQPGCHHAQQLDNVLLRLTCRDAPVQQGSWARSSWPTPTASGSWRGSIAGFSSAADTSIQTQQAAAPLPTPHSVPSPPSESPAGEAPPRRRVPKPRRLEPRKISLPPPVLVMRVFAVFTITVAAGLVAYDTHVWPRLIEQLRSDDEEARQAAMLAVPTSVPFEVTTPPFVAQSGIAVLLSNLEEPKASQNSEDTWAALAKCLQHFASMPTTRTALLEGGAVPKLEQALRSSCIPSSQIEAMHAVYLDLHAAMAQRLESMLLAAPPAPIPLASLQRAA